MDDYCHYCGVRLDLSDEYADIDEKDPAMSIPLSGTVKAIYEAFGVHVDAVSFQVWSDQQEPWWPAEFEAAEMAHDAYMG